MNKKKQQVDDLEKTLTQKLADYTVDGKPLPGIVALDSRSALVAQMIESVRRIDYVSAIANRSISESRKNPKNAEMFDPLRAAILYKKTGNIDEAFWLTFLFVHCGKHLSKGYGLLRMVYGAYNDEFVWTWERFSSQPQDFAIWLHQHLDDILRERKRFPFGNHRKYESINHLDSVLKSYVDWVGPARSHVSMINQAAQHVGQNPKKLFDYLYKSMDAVERFGRTGKFDYLTMVGKLGLADIAPPSAYMIDATGPVRGARLLFGGDVKFNIAKRDLDALSVQLDGTLGIGMQAIEDSLCNWQKSPNEFKAFRG